MSEFGKGIPLASGFDLGAKKPLDSRYVVDTIVERDAHVTSNRAYEGMQVYVEEDKTTYRWNGESWDIIPTKEYIDEKLANIEIGEDQLEDFVTKDEIVNVQDEWLGGKKLRYLTQEEYDLLTDEEKNDETIVWNITDIDNTGDFITKEDFDENHIPITNAEMDVMISELFKK